MFARDLPFSFPKIYFSFSAILNYPKYPYDNVQLLSTMTSNTEIFMYVSKQAIQSMDFSTLENIVLLVIAVIIHINETAVSSALLKSFSRGFGQAP